MALTQSRASGAFTGKRYGSFAGRDAGATHPVDTITQARSTAAFTGKRYGSFAGRDAGATHPVDTITQARSTAAFTGRRYGSFAGRTEAPPEPPVFTPGGGSFKLPMQAIDSQRLGIISADDWLMLIAASAYRHRVLH